MTIPGARVWVAGARPRTLGAAVSPVLVGTAVAATDGPVRAWRAGAALVVSVAIQVGTNYANDYSDGLRGTDSAARKGPVRLTAAGLKSPAAVRAAAVLSFAVAACAGLALAVAVDLRLLVVGAICVAAGALYTGGPRPYGYAGLGEVAVLVFFGFVATCGSAYVQLRRVPGLALAASVPVGLLACAILLANNVRDVDSDGAAKKRTLAVMLGPHRSRLLFRTSVVVALLAVAAIGIVRPWALMALAAAPLAVPALKAISRPDPPGLAAALVGAGRLQLSVSALLAAGLWASR